MKSDKKGRFTSKSDDKGDYKFTITFPSIKNMIFWKFIINIVSPCALVFERSKILQKLIDFFENVLVGNEGSESSKKNGLFY